jgi:hypothetical protein
MHRSKRPERSLIIHNKYKKSYRHFSFKLTKLGFILVT